MAITGSVATGQLAGLLRGEDGLTASYGALLIPESLRLERINGTDVLEMHASADLTEKSASIKYPLIHVYCERVVNKLTEKFRTFSGTADLNIEIRVSDDHLPQLQQSLQAHVEAVTDVLDRKRGSWGFGVYYTGGYEVVFSPVKRGGRNYLQSARVRLEVHISLD